MIEELKRQEFSKCLDLLNECGQLEAVAIIKGVNPGRIFVDNRISPRSGFIWLGNNDGFIFFGDEQSKSFNKEINYYLDQVIIPQAKKQNIKWFECIGNHEKWNKKIEELFNYRELSNWNQKAYQLNRKHYNMSTKMQLEKGYVIQRVTKEIYESDLIKNKEWLQSIISEFWENVNDFLQNGLAYCAIHKDEIVSICYSGFVVDSVHCVGIETLETHQGKKLAQAVAHSFVEECLRNGQTLYWDCMEGNKPSVAIAEKLGFVNTYNYLGFEFRI